MSVLWRVITDNNDWKGMTRFGDAEKNMPPLWWISLFIPSVRDDGTLSVYEAAPDSGDLEIFGSAISMFSEGPVRTIGVPVAKLRSAGLTVTSSLGTTFDATANALHRDIGVPDFSAASKVASLYAVGDPKIFERNVARTALWQRVRSGLVRIGHAAQSARDTSQYREAMLAVEKKAAYVVGGNPP